MTGDADNIEEFIDRWGTASGGERSNYQMFLTVLCVLLDVPKPDPAVEIDGRNAYVF